MGLAKIAKTIGQVSIGFAVLVLILELALRPFGYGSHTVYMPDDRLLWVPVPGQRSLTVINHQPLTINDEGFRYSRSVAAKGDDDVSIFAFGDSVTMGWGVADDAHYSAVLERLLAEQPPMPGKRFRVVSAGVNAYSNALVLERFRTVVEDGFEPKVAIIAYSFNSGFENVTELRGTERTQFLQRVRLKGWLARSAFYSFTIEGVLRDTVYYRLRDRLVAGSWETSSAAPAVGTAVSEAARYKSQLGAMKTLADARGITPILVLLGSSGQRAHAHPLQAAMREFAAEADVRIVDMIDALKGADHGALFMDHVHPNTKGHELIALELLTPVREAVSELRRDAYEHASTR